MMHHTSPDMLQGAPVALVLAREDEALTHGQVLYGLVKPTKDMKQVESTAAMVNVIPKKRIYRMEEKEEIDLFAAELMKRPLVIQPSAHIGRGLSVIGCTLYTREERWLMMVNQLHPKIMEMFEAGLAQAKERMEHGVPFVMELSFNEYLKKIYLDRLTKAVLNPKFTFIEFEDAEIVIRYPGNSFHKNMIRELKTTQIKFHFENLDERAVIRRTVQSASSEWRSPALRVVPVDELSQLLPSWRFNEEDTVVPESEEDLEENPPSYDELEAKGAVGGSGPGGQDTRDASPVAPTRVVGRAKRKANASAKYEVPVELHVPEPGGPQVLVQRGNITPSPTSPYENLNRRRNENEHVYSISNGIPMQDLSRRPNADQGYKQGPTAPVYPSTPEREVRNGLSPVGLRGGPGYRQGDSSPFPMKPGSSQYGTDYNRQTPVDSQPNMSPRSPRSLYRPQDDNYDEDDDGGFSRPAPVPKPRTVSRSRVQQLSDSGYDQDKYRTDSGSGSGSRYESNRTDPTFQQNRYLSEGGSNTGYPAPSRASPSPRGFNHTHQGSGRSESSASDSGFGDNDESAKHRQEKYAHMPPPHKAPYYNHGFEQENDQGQSMNDILAQHKALAAKMFHGQSQGQGQNNVDSQRQYNRQDRYNGQDYYNDSSYNKQLQMYRQNINDLEDACDNPEVDFSRTRLRMGSHGGQEPMDESFI